MRHQSNCMPAFHGRSHQCAYQYAITTQITPSGSIGWNCIVAPTDGKSLLRHRTHDSFDWNETFKCIKQFVCGVSTVVGPSALFDTVHQMPLARCYMHIYRCSGKKVKAKTTLKHYDSDGTRLRVRVDTSQVITSRREDAGDLTEFLVSNFQESSKCTKCRRAHRRDGNDSSVLVCARGVTVASLCKHLNVVSCNGSAAPTSTYSIYSGRLKCTAWVWPDTEHIHVHTLLALERLCNIRVFASAVRWNRRRHSSNQFLILGQRAWRWFTCFGYTSAPLHIWLLCMRSNLC